DKEYRELAESLARAAAAAPRRAATFEAPIEAVPSSDTTEPVEPLETASVADTPTPLPEPPAAVPGEQTAAAPGGEPRGGAVADRSVRVDVALLDSLMNQVGELVLARNQILQYSASQDDPVFLTTTQRLNLITTELQEGVMKTRMQPIGTIWHKLPRVVRDLARTCNKRVRIEMEGEDTELDRTLIEAIKDPLTHVIRNAIDHGVETPEDRVARGKPAEGCISLSAYHEGGHVNIEVCDDGRGIDRQKVKDSAIRSNRITAEQASKLTDREALALIFDPGLSTAAKVTNISGRGVGMDVVKTNIEQIGGTVDIQSTVGSGTTLRIKIPLTLAIIPALLITSGGERYAIPQVCLLELVRLQGDRARSVIEMVHDVPVFRRRGRLLPLVWLNEQLGIGERTELQNDPKSVLNIAVLQADERQFGLVVDEINDNQEIVVKPLGKLLCGLTSYAGATIMGDGRIALILDALGIAQRAGVISHSRGGVAQAGREDSEARANDGPESLLLFATRPGAQMAVPLDHVARLEEIEQARVEHAGGHMVVQYRGEIMPLIPLCHTIGDPSPTSTDGPLQVIVCSRGGPAVGIVVDSILDILEHDSVIRPHVTRRGVLGTAVVQGRVTEILDTESVVAMAGFDACAPAGACS
ncbi:MAG: chemotaxis protein CheW, partial [Planctomycetes bacterium]|nr:chemotaxis protein CheW [Planctomycetota bacterium]